MAFRTSWMASHATIRSICKNDVGDRCCEKWYGSRSFLVQKVINFSQQRKLVLFLCAFLRDVWCPVGSCFLVTRACFRHFCVCVRAVCRSRSKIATYAELHYYCTITTYKNNNTTPGNPSEWLFMFQNNANVVRKIRPLACFVSLNHPIKLYP